MPIALAHTETPLQDRHAQAARLPAAPRAPSPVPAHVSQDDDHFMALQAAYRGQGGIARAEALAACMGVADGGGYVDLARRIVAGQLFSFKWHHSCWLPLFQFDPGSHAMRAGPSQVLAELHDVYDGWDMAGWWVRANDALDGRRPLDLLDHDLPAVLAAARADRFTVDG